MEVGALILLVLAQAIFIGSHLGLASPRVREPLIARMGENSFRGFFALMALGTLMGVISAWRLAPQVELWPGGSWFGLAPLLLMLPALLFLVAGVSQSNPSAAGQKLGADPGAAVRGVMRITRHPLMWAIGLWGLAHVIAAGDLASLIFFGGLAGLAIGGAARLDRKHARLQGEGWHRFASQTSFIPFAAIAAGRHGLGQTLVELGPVRLGVSAGLYLLLVAGHGWPF